MASDATELLAFDHAGSFMYDIRDICKLYGGSESTFVGYTMVRPISITVFVSVNSSYFLRMMLMLLPL